MSACRTGARTHARTIRYDDAQSIALKVGLARDLHLSIGLFSAEMAGAVDGTGKAAWDALRAFRGVA